MNQRNAVEESAIEDGDQMRRRFAPITMKISSGARQAATRYPFARLVRLCGDSLQERKEKRK
jgi:hypothetical protein